MKNHLPFKFIALLFVLLFNIQAKSQCSANFTYTVGANGSVAFTNNSMPVSASVNYSWNFGDSQYSSQTNPTHIYGANGVYLVILQRSDSLQTCNATYSAQITVTNVACNVNPGFTFNVNSNGLVTFVNTSTGTIPQTMYYLQYGDNTSTSFPNNSFTSNNHTYTTSGTYNATLTAFNNSVSCYSSYTANITVTVQPCNLSAGFTYTVNNNTVNFTNITTGASPSATYYWTFGNSNAYYGVNPPAQTYPSNGQYQVYLHVSDSVSSSSCISSQTQTITLTNANCLASANFAMFKDTTVTSSIVWNAYPSYPSNVSAVSWNWGDNSTSTGLYPSHTYSATGFYNICLTVSVSCGSSTTTCINQNIFRTSNSMQMATVNVINSLVTGINKNAVTTAEIRLFPNPVKDILTIETEKADYNVTVSDLYGKVIFTGSNTKNINTQNFNTGIYFVKISGTGFSKTSKIVKD